MNSPAVKHGHDDFAQEPIRGLPEHLPTGERILWQGAPCWTVLARNALHTRKATIYFSLLLIWSGYSSWAEGASPLHAIGNALWLVPLALTAIGILALLAYLYSRTTVFTITNKRLVMRFGIALPITLNIPFKLIESADLKMYPDGSGDISVKLHGNNRIALFVLWPFARPWRAAKPEPMLRAIPESERVASILARALASAANVATWQPGEQVTKSAPQSASPHSFDPITH